MNDAQLIEHLHARGWSLDKIDVAMIREGAAALQADALAAIKAARVHALEEAIAACQAEAVEDTGPTDSAYNRAIGHVSDAIRLLGEDAGRGEPDLDDDGEPIKRCSVCGDPVRYGSRHHGCAPTSAGRGE